MLTLSADKHIPLVSELFSPFFKINFLDTEEINAENLKHTDVLLVRSITRVDKNLLENTPVKFVASPISGSDHIDKTYLQKKNIEWITAPGCNAPSVADYVICCIAIAFKKNILSQHKKLRAGIIGVGHVGSLVAKQLKNIGFDVLLNDPPRAETEEHFDSISLDQFTNLDVICLHTPLTKSGPHPTFHLINRSFLSRQKKDCLMISAGRGAVINFEDLKQYGRHLHWCIDVWEHEPNIDLEVLSNAFIATQHIAGHAIQSKWRGVEMIFDEIKNYFSLEQQPIIELPIKPPTLNIDADNWKDAILNIYDPEQESIKMKQRLSHSQNIAHDFEWLRKNYPIRHELSFPVLKIKNMSDVDQNILKLLGCRLEI